MEPKKRSVGASERDEFLRAAWRVMVAGEVRTERLVFLRTSAPPTPRWHPSTLGLDEESELFVRSHATGGEHNALGEHERGRDGSVPGGRRPYHAGGLRDLSGGRLGAFAQGRTSGGNGQPLFSRRL